MDEQPKPKVPIFEKRRLSKPVSTRLTVEEVAAIAAAKAKAEADAELAARAAEQAAEEAKKPAPAPIAKPAKAAPAPKRQPVRPAPPKAEVKSAEPALTTPAIVVTKPESTTPEPSPESTTNTTADRAMLDDPDTQTTDTTPEKTRPRLQFKRPAIKLHFRLPRLPKLAIKQPKVLSQLGQVTRLSSAGAPSVDTWLVIAVLALLSGNQLALIWYTKAGLIVSMVTILCLTLLALFRDVQRKLAISLAIIPVAQLLSSTIVTHNGFQSAAVLYATLLALAMTYRYLFTLDEPVEGTRLRWMGHFFGLPLMLLLGQLLGALDYGVLRHHYDYLHISLPLVFAACIVFAFAEEMLLRGLIQQQAMRLTNPVIAIALPSALYIVLSISRNNLIGIIPAAVTGIVLAVVYQQKHNLVLTTAVNAASKLAYVGLVATFILR